MQPPPHSASGVFVPMTWRKNTTKFFAAGDDHHVCKWSICASKWKEKHHHCVHQHKLQWDAPTMCNYNYNHHSHWLDQDQHGCCWSDQYSNQCNLGKGHEMVWPYASCIDCCIGHSNGTHAGPDLDSGGGGCSCMLLVQLVLAVFFLSSIGAILYLHMWWSSPAVTCTDG